MEEPNAKKDNLEVRQAWDDNAAYWDEYIGEGNDFVEVLCWPVMKALLNIRPGSRVLDIACGNGLTSRRLAELGYEVEAFDFSERMIEKAKVRTHAQVGKIRYHVIDGTDEKALLKLGADEFDGAFSNMALFDMAEIDPLFRALPNTKRRLCSCLAGTTETTACLPQTASSSVRTWI